MKKRLCIAACLAVAGGLAAQGFSFSGYLDSGVGVFFPDRDPAKRVSGYSGRMDPFLRLVSSDSGFDGWNARLGGSYANEGGTAGARVMVQARGEAEDALRLEYFYGWLEAFGGRARLLGGKVDDDTFAAGSPAFSGDAGESFGLLAVARPFAFLEIGLGVYAPLTTATVTELTAPSGGGTVASTETTTTRGVAAGPLDNGKYTAGLALTLPGLFKATATYRNANGTGDTSETPFLKGRSADNSENEEDSQAAFGVAFDALKTEGLFFTLAGAVNNLQDRGRAVARVFESVSYTGIRGWSINLALSQAGSYETRPGGKDSDISFRAWLWASRELPGGGAVFRADLNYLYGGYIDNIYRLHYTDRYMPNFDAEASLFTLRPAIAFRVNEHTGFELGYCFIRYIGSESRMWNPITTAANASGVGTTRIAYAGMRVSF
jgi:hypothetical protein